MDEMGTYKVKVNLEGKSIVYTVDAENENVAILRVGTKDCELLANQKILSVEVE